MSKAYDFLRMCGAFFVLTMNGDYPAGRPFGVVVEVDEHLYIATNDRNQVHKQLREHEQIQIVAKKSDSRDWIRITGLATECKNDYVVRKMINEFEVMKRKYGSGDIEHLLIFRVTVENVEFHS